MKILYIAHDSNLFGGANLALLDMLDCIKAKKEYVAIVLVPKKEGSLINELERRNIKYIVFNYHWWAFNKSKNNLINILRYSKVIFNQFRQKINIKKLSNIILHEEIDIIHTNSSVINIGADLSKKINKNHIWQVREFGEEHLNLQFLFGLKWSRKLMHKKSSAIILISNALYKKYENIIGIEKLNLIYDGISEKYINYTQKTLNKNVFKILQVANIQRGKGQLEAIEAILDLYKEQYNIELHIVGAIGEIDYYNEVVNKSKANYNIIFHGEIKDYKILKEIRKEMDCEITCSEMEAFGRVTIEGMLSCLPIIASNSGANNELICDFKNGLKYKKYNKSDLKEKIKFMYNNREKSLEMGLQGYNFAKNNFIQDINYNNISFLYKKFYKRNK